MLPVVWARQVEGRRQEVPGRVIDTPTRLTHILSSALPRPAWLR